MLARGKQRNYYPDALSFLKNEFLYHVISYVSAVVDGGYTEWSSWGNCSRSCNGGTQRRDRNCSNPTPAHGGRGCRRLGQSTRTQYCNAHPCPGNI